MTIKQTISLISVIVLVFAASLGLGTFGSVQTARAYVCVDSSNPDPLNPATGSVWQYNQQTGQCEKINYTNRNVDRTPKYNSTTQTMECPGGGAYTNGNCKAVCSPGDVYHADDNTCWYKDGIDTSQTGKITPVKNDGTALSSDEYTCTNGLRYVNDGGNSGCYYIDSNGNKPCGKDQVLQATNPQAVAQGHPSDYECQATSKGNIVPKNKAQSSDGTDCKYGAKDGGVCKPYSDFTNKNSCVSHGGRFVLTDAKDQNNASDDVWTCVSPSNLSCPNGGTPDANNKCPDGSDATLKSTSSNNQVIDDGDGGTGRHCGQAQTIIIECDEKTGAPAIGAVLKIAVNVLSAIIAVAAVGGLAYASILYAKAEDNQGNVSEARTIIRNIIIGILLYGFLVVIVNWLVPGGVIGT